MKINASFLCTSPVDGFPGPKKQMGLEVAGSLPMSPFPTQPRPTALSLRSCAHLTVGSTRRGAGPPPETGGGRQQACGGGNAERKAPGWTSSLHRQAFDSNLKTFSHVNKNLKSVVHEIFL